MKSLIQKLNEICTAHPFSEKRLIVDNYQTGEQILLAFANAGHRAMNLRVITLKDMAKTIIDLHSVYIKERVTPTIGSLLLNPILTTLKTQKSLHYLHNLENTSSLNHALYQTVQLFRLSGITSDHFPLDKFKTVEKAIDFKRILHAYEEMLAEKQLWDDAKIYKEAIHLAETEFFNDSLYIFQHNLSFLKLEEEFASVLLQKTSYILPIAPVDGLQAPSRFPFIRDAVGEESDFSYLYDVLPKLQQKKKLELFASSTEESELNEVLRRIKHKAATFDSCSIYYSDRDPYRLIMFQLSESMNIPVTFGEGVPITITTPGKLVSILLNWFKNQFRVSFFLPLLKEGILEFEKDSPSYTSIIAMLTTSEIGWGKDRYLVQLQKQINRLNDKVSFSLGEEQENYQRLQKDYIWLQQWLKNVFQIIPNETSKTGIKSFLTLFRYLLTNYIKIKSPYDNAARNSLMELIDTINPFIVETQTAEEFIRLLEDLFLTRSVGASNPKPGSIHFTSYKQGMFIDRKHLFFIGFSHQRFPGKRKEDPLLLDGERKTLDSNLPLQTEKTKENVYYLSQIFANTKGYPTISYPIFDLQENCSNLPSSFFLNCYRYQTGDIHADIDTVNKKYQKISLPLNPINLKEWWLNLLQNNIFPKNIMNHLLYGQKAKTARQSNLFTEYDGRIITSEQLLDPRKNKAIRMSSGRLEKLAACPYKYFLEDVLQIQPLESIEMDQNVWLDALQRGTLLHEIYEDYYKTIQALKVKPSFKEHESILLDIALIRIKKWKEKYNPPSNNVYEQTLNELLESCQIFLKSEEEYADNSIPMYFEYSFGIGEEPPAIVTLTTGESFQLSGKIDRVDQNFDSSYSIIDYKTGGAGKYHLKRYFAGGRQLQHFLYAKALENKLQLTDGVKSSTYLFPTTKGVGARRERIQDKSTRENGLDILERLFDLLMHGHFIMTDDVKKDCTYCDYKSVCKRSLYTKGIYETKGMDISAVGLNRWKGVRAYD